MASESTTTNVSNSFPETTPLSQWDLQLSQIINSLGAQTYNWAQGVYGQTSAMTDNLINQFQAQANSDVGNASALMGQYNAVAPGELNSLAQDAATYASTPRIQQAMGAAESATGQSMDQGRINAEQHLQSFGIDPSSGRYQELEQAQQASKAAAQAGAGQEAELATEATGRQLRNESIAAEQQVPGQAVNFMTNAVGAVQGASQANIGNAAVGAQLMDAAAPYENSAMNIKYPPNASSSSGFSQTQNSGGSSGSSGSGSGGGGSGGGGGGSGDTTQFYGDPTPSGEPDYVNTAGLGDGFAAGGGVLPSPTTGGHVPAQASPSMGQNTDDVNARLNAGEFVVPRDVAAWKGQEFFQKLIDESRRKRLGAPAKGKPKPALSGPPAFTSHPIPPQGQQQMGAQ